MNETSRVNYIILEKSAVFEIDGKTISIGLGDHRFSKAVDALDRGDLSSVVKIIDPSHSLGMEELTVKDGLIHYKDKPIPAAFTNKMLEFKSNPDCLMALINFWFNLKQRNGFKNHQKEIISILNQDAYPITTDGFIVCYRGNDDQIVNLKNINSGIVRFYDYNGATPAELFQDKLTLEKICENMFGFCSKKLLKLVSASMFQPNNNTVNTSVLNYGVIFKEIVSMDTLFWLIEKQSISGNVITPDESIWINKLITEICTQEDGKINEKRIKSLFSCNIETKKLIELGGIFEGATNNKIDLNIRKLKISTISDMHDFIKQEYSEYLVGNALLYIERSFPEVSRIKKVTVNDMHFIIPKSRFQLIDWSREMSNCVKDYSDDIIQGDHYILGVSKPGDKSNLKYNFSVRNRVLTQIKSKGNGTVPQKDKEEIIKTLKYYGLIK